MPQHIIRAETCSPVTENRTADEDGIVIIIRVGEDYGGAGTQAAVVRRIGLAAAAVNEEMSEPLLLQWIEADIRILEKVLSPVIAFQLEGIYSQSVNLDGITEEEFGGSSLQG